MISLRVLAFASSLACLTTAVSCTDDAPAGKVEGANGGGGSGVSQVGGKPGTGGAKLIGGRGGSPGGAGGKAALASGGGGTGGSATATPPDPTGTGGGGGATAGGGAMGGGPAVQPAACAPGTIYDFSAPFLGLAEPTSLCNYAGKVLLVVNVASKCGYTPQYKPLQALYKKYETQGFVVLGFPSANFGDQEFHDDKDISAFCTSNYGITFPLFSRIDVTGPAQHPLYAWLTKQPGGEGEITWNFNKFLIGKDGVFLERFDTAVTPEAPALIQAVEAALLAP